jgi:signal transduction histidine kinase/ActR/RegA family two-component response regulator
MAGYTVQVAETMGASGSDVRRLAWTDLRREAQVYVAFVVIAGAIVLAQTLPLNISRPLLSAAVLAAACVTATWKVHLPIPLVSGSTLSVSCAAKLMALLLLGPGQAVIVAAAASLTQCTYGAAQRYPFYRTIFSMMGDVIAMTGTGLAYVALGGSPPPFDLPGIAKPLVGAIAAYFVLDTGLVAGAIGASSGRSIFSVWRDEFLWSGVTFMVAGSVGALAAVLVDRGYQWLAILLLAPVYLIYRTYQIFIARLEDQQRHMTEMSRMHDETVNALSQAHQAERALAKEKERLAAALAEMTQLEHTRNELLEREHALRAGAEQANTLKDRFLAIVSHELRTPLNAILGWSDMLRGGKLDESRRQRAFRAIHDSATRQAALIEELLDMSRIMSGKLRLERTFADPEDIIRSALNIVQPAAEGRQIDIEVECDPAVGVIYADRARLQQIVWNLLSNAIKFSPEHGIVRLRLRRVGDHVELMVSDAGEGIPREFLSSMFQPFQQADASTTRQHGGLGLGLSIVKYLVEAHGGTVSGYSPGRGLGATFTVRLPIAPASAGQAEIGMAETPTIARQPLSPTMLDGVSVLVVDDDEQGLQVVAAQLEGHNANVLTAASAAQALDVLQRVHVDVLLADIAMPGQDGYELIRQVRAMHPSPVASVPAAALTAFARMEDRVAALQAGFQSHLAKPVDAYSLVATVARLGGKLPDRRQSRGGVPNRSVILH